jgi:hypothetical protein
MELLKGRLKLEKEVFESEETHGKPTQVVDLLYDEDEDEEEEEEEEEETDDCSCFNIKLKN